MTAPPGAARMGVAVVGLGRAGAFHLSSLRSMSDQCELHWVVDIDLARAQGIALQQGCRAAARLDEALADPAVGAVIICSSTQSHYALCKAALAAGKHVFTEKPISLEPAQLAEVVELAIACGRAFVVGYQRRCDHNFRELRRQVVEQRACGQLRLIKCCSRDNPRPPLEYLAQSGGIFHDMLCHDFDMLHFLSGQQPTEVSTAAHCHDPEIAELDDVDMVVTTLK